MHRATATTAPRDLLTRGYRAPRPYLSRAPPHIGTITRLFDAGAPVTERPIALSLAHAEATRMIEHQYWIGRKRAAMAAARRATSSESRLIHYDLAGRCSIKAAQSLPFIPAPTGPATEGEREALRLPTPLPDPPASTGRNERGPPERRR